MLVDCSLILGKAIQLVFADNGRCSVVRCVHRRILPIYAP